jgi:hypothetical protein
LSENAGHDLKSVFADHFLDEAFFEYGIRCFQTAQPAFEVIEFIKVVISGHPLEALQSTFQLIPVIFKCN